MDLREATSLLNKFAPNNCHDICTLITGIQHELENTKNCLEAELIERQKSSDYQSLHDIISLQEILSEYITETANFVNYYKQEKKSNEQTVRPVKKRKKPLPLVDTDWYTIDQNDVTYKHLHALLFRNHQVAVEQWTSCYVEICNILYKKNPAIIERMLYHEGHGIKISNHPKDLRAPKKIEGSRLWLDVHDSAVNIRRHILRLLDLYHVPYEDVKVLYSDKLAVKE
ncbi:hypothetical protein SELR_03100 [Selenomonas ruminantium subsp. lactilytica TAM6421]|uniref:Uncharacterized protein n=1 Tax=Selenomonas ruminantium subsp. lactilytica (strain NBRC 103574 / TAM6421) TaxID=927704 RepID=I0GMN1_SELRL|nr:hypothetical protein [Selenomonas ruminantium]BAL82018.1 hypothetical protein SELR_03100 [Selenomonas ruminantium subsp. lactilytica TAM6421]